MVAAVVDMEDVEQLLELCCRRCHHLRLLRAIEKTVDGFIAQPPRLQPMQILTHVSPRWKQGSPRLSALAAPLGRTTFRLGC